MKLYNRVNSAFGLACVALLVLSTSAHAGKSNPLAAVMGTSEAQMTIDQTVGVSNARLLKLLDGTTGANRGPGVCGDEEPDDGEQCDDGNTADLDGCDATCQVEPGSDCTAAIAGVSTSNAITNGSWADGIGTGWTYGPQRAFICSDFCFGGDLSSDLDSGFAIFGSGGPTAIPSSFAAQTVSVPSDATTITFDWFGAATTAPACDDAGPERFILSLDLSNTAGTTTVFATDPDADCDGTPYNSETIDLATACAGGSDCRGTDVTITFNADYPGVPSGNANMFLDNVRVNVILAEPIPPVPSSCLVGVCGDGILSDLEGCDDGNLAAGDGCDASCNVEEDNWVCDNLLVDTALDFLRGSLSSTNDVVDGGLEQGSPNPDWVEEGTVFTPICSEGFCGAALAADGDFFGWFGGASEENHQTLTQTDVLISSDATALTFEMLVGVCDGPTDQFSVTIDGNEEFLFLCTSEPDGYITYSVDLVGPGYNDDGLHEIVFAGDTFSANGSNTNFFLDNVAISYGVTPDRAPNSSECFELDGICSTPSRGVGGVGFGIEKFEAGLGIMTTFELGTLSAPAEWTTTVDLWTSVGDPSGCGSDLSVMDPVANWPGGNLTGGSGEAACADSDGAAESLATGGPQIACLDAVDPTLSCQTHTYLCTPGIDTTNMTDPGVTATVHYQTATQDFDTEAEDDEIFQVLVGDTSPNPFSIGNYRSAGVVIDHNSGTTLSSGALTIGVNLDDFRDPAVQPVDPDTMIQIDPLDADNLHVCFLYKGIYSWWGEVDNVASRADNCTVGDADFDLVPDDIDNCTLKPNPDQRDTDGDDIGNVCDADVRDPNDCLVNFLDLLDYRANFFQSGDFDTDNNGDGITNFLDLLLVREQFFQAPGPSAAGCDTMLP